MAHDKNSTTHHACPDSIKEYGGLAACCACTNHACYNPISHKESECRNDHPILGKVPVGFRGFHDEDYMED